MKFRVKEVETWIQVHKNQFLEFWQNQAWILKSSLQKSAWRQDMTNLSRYNIEDAPLSAACLPAGDC